MADNLVTTTTVSTVPDGTTIAADDVSGVFYQRVKLADGTADSATLIAAGGGVEANALRVTIASDSTGVVSVDDNGASLTVDGTVAATQSGTWTVTGTGGSFPVTDSGGSLTVDNGGTFAVQASIAAAQTLATVTTVGTVTSVTAIGTSVTPGTSAAHLGKAEDAAHVSGDTGVYALAVRADTPAVSSGTTGDYSSLNVNAQGALWVSLTPNTTGGVTVYFAVAANSTNATNVKASAGSIYGWNCTNEGTAWAYLKFHNTAGTPTAGSGVAYCVGIPPGGGTNESIPEGIPFGTGIGITVTAGIAANDTTAVPASKVNVNIRYK